MPPHRQPRQRPTQTLAPRWRASRLIVVSKVALRATALTQECLGSSHKLLSVDAETADGSVKVLVVGSGELPQRNQIETRTVPLLFGNRLDVKVIYADSFTIGGREL